jgi:aspartyl-tRNA(Asn)/glutamyl-tRNA(Gln) amidotransferase subunit C
VSVSREEVERIAALARLKLQPDEVVGFTGELNAILDHMTELREVDVEGVSEMIGVVEGGAPTRSPRALPDPLQRPLQEVAPDWREGFFVVPRLPAMEGHPGDAAVDLEGVS